MSIITELGAVTSEAALILIELKLIAGLRRKWIFLALIRSGDSHGR